MHLHAFLVCCACGLFLAPAPASAQSSPPEEPAAAPSVPARDSLDRSRIHAEYGDGNFEIVIQVLEEFRGTHKDIARVDSLFMAKYLGVVYASNPATREKGKYWLYRMLQMEPTSDLVDMYVGEQVDRTFEKVRQEFIVRRNYRGINDLKLRTSVESGDKPKDTVVVRDTVRVGSQAGDSLPARTLKDFRHGWTWNLNLGAGLKLMNEADWGTTRNQKEIRLAFDIRQRRWPINVAIDFMYSKSDDNVIELSDGSLASYAQSSTELNAGVRKIFDMRFYSMRPFFGGGFGYVTTGYEAFDFRKSTVGAWSDGGVYWELERHFNIGAEFIWSWAKIPYEVLEEGGGSRLADAGGLHFQMIVGYHW
ncbi:MAG TPA: hypothetical protein VK465_02575 [Fibrobacteria bacterium]|nr:hypothetical protein [Fibrobacteria bacterium]